MWHTHNFHTSTYLHQHSTLGTPSQIAIISGSDPACGTLPINSMWWWTSETLWTAGFSCLRVTEGDEVDQGQISACILLQNISSISCYREELENIFRSLHHIEQTGTTPKEVEQWCNNEQATNNSSLTFTDPKQMIHEDAAVLLAIHHLKNHFPFKSSISMCMLTKTWGLGGRRVDKNRRRWRRFVIWYWQWDTMLTAPSSSDDLSIDDASLGKMLILDLIPGSCQPRNPCKKEPSGKNI